MADDEAGPWSDYAAPTQNAKEEEGPWSDYQAKPSSQTWNQEAPDWKKSVAGFATGVGKMVPYGQDIPAAIGATLSKAGLMHGSKAIPEEGTWGERFDAAKRAQMKTAEEASKYAPKSHMLGEATGLIGSMAPLGRAAALEGRLAEAAKNAVGGGRYLGNLAKGATHVAGGAGMGAAYGLGEGVTPEERLQNAKTGAITGAVLTPVVAGATRLPGLLAQTGRKMFPGAIEGAERSANRQIAEAANVDRTLGSERNYLTPQEAQAAVARGQPVLPIDVVGETGRDALRAATNTSEQAQALARDPIRARYESQAARYENQIKGMMNHDLDAAGIQDEMRQAAHEINRPAYRRAYEEGSGGVWNPELARLANSPAIREALPDVLNKASNRAALEGVPAIRNPFITNAETGALELRDPGVRPNLEFWDHVKRSLDDTIGGLDRKGEYANSRDLKNIRQRLLNNLDNSVDSYAEARRGAASMFGADNAFDAGLNFMKTKSTLNLSQAKQAFNRMGQPEREIFAHGVMSDIVNNIRNKRSGQDIVKMFDTPNDREKLEMVLGPDRYSELEAFTRVENIMQRAESAIAGNSTTMKQASRMGHLGSAVGSALRHGVGQITGATLAGLPGYAVGAVADAVANQLSGMFAKDQAREIARKLTSRDPQAMQEVVQLIASKPEALNRLRNIDMSLRSLGTEAITKLNERHKRASGGKIPKRDYPAKRLTLAAKKAHREIANETESLMGLPDEHIAHALHIAKG